MYYIIFGKYQKQNKPLNSGIKLSLWDKDAIIAMFAKKYLQHKPKSLLHNQDVYFLEKVKVYKLEENQYESNGDVIMLDINKIQNYKYPEIEIHNTSLNAFCDKLKTETKDTNIVIQLFNI
jgi:hypothetical protein